MMQRPHYFVISAKHHAPRDPDLRVSRKPHLLKLGKKALNQMEARGTSLVIGRHYRGLRETVLVPRLNVGLIRQATSTMLALRAMKGFSPHTFDAIRIGGDALPLRKRYEFDHDGCKFRLSGCR